MDATNRERLCVHNVTPSGYTCAFPQQLYVNTGKVFLKEAIESHRFVGYRHSRKSASLQCQQPFPPIEVLSTHFYYRLSWLHGHGEAKNLTGIESNNFAPVKGYSVQHAFPSSTTYMRAINILVRDWNCHYRRWLSSYLWIVHPPNKLAQFWK